MMIMMIMMVWLVLVVVYKIELYIPRLYIITNTMLLRSGKMKEPVAKCYKCNEFYGNKRYRYKCSGCHGAVLKSSYPWRKEEFRNRVNKWAQEKIRITKDSGGFRTLRQFVRRAYSGLCPKELRVNACKGLISKLQEVYKEQGDEFYISAKDGEELLRRTGQDTPEKFHIICPLVLDWWNMKYCDYRGAEMCYYGRFGDEMTFCEQIRSVPPPPPNKCMI